jgi:hypothetical protein
VSAQQILTAKSHLANSPGHEALFARYPSLLRVKGVDSSAFALGPA